jgi:hypothetical protein
MQLALTAKNNTDSVRGGLTYINSIISDASSNGEYFLFVDGIYMDDDMMGNLIVNYGYNVSKQFFDMGTYPRYLIQFS